MKSRSAAAKAELEAQILGDAAAMRAFFQHARVIEDDEFLAGFARDLRGMPQELSRDACMQFLRSVNDRYRLGDPVAKADRLRTSELIMREADTLPIPRQHPVVLVMGIEKMDHQVKTSYSQFQTEQLYLITLATNLQI